ncbi:MAG: RHS repeat-associated core domain-containing protein [Spirochaetales bacterium]|nr:RHS repeat-associated core domain-containing protein [Spirochaetales bacterium]
MILRENNKLIDSADTFSLYFYLTDHPRLHGRAGSLLPTRLGSTVLMTDVEGNILWQNDFTPFGEETGASGFVERDGFYTGKKIDSHTGLYYFNARWYDPQLGRFITEDPVKDGLNWFSYVANNPLRYTDPTGLMAIRSYQDYQYVMQGWGNEVTFGASGLLHKEGCFSSQKDLSVSSVLCPYCVAIYELENTEPLMNPSL